MTDPTTELVEVTQEDIETLARIHEEGGNKAAAFTLRQVGAVGCVLESQAQLIARHRLSTRSMAPEQVEVAASVYELQKTVGRLCEALRGVISSGANSYRNGDQKHDDVVIAQGAYTDCIAALGGSPLADELERLAKKATPGPYDVTTTGLVRALRDDLAVPIFEPRQSYDPLPAPTVRYPSGKVQFRKNSEGAKISRAFREERANSQLVAALLNSLPAILAALRTQPQPDIQSLLAGERRKAISEIVEWLRSPAGKGDDDGIDYADGFADQIEARSLSGEVGG